MPLIFEIEQKPTFKSKVVFGVEIPIYGELTVDEVIAVERAIVSEIDRSKPVSNTEWVIVQVTAWLKVRLGEDIRSQLLKSKVLCDALWDVFYAEQEGNTTDYEIDEPVTEGKDEPTVPSLISSENGTPSISSSQLADLRQNSLVTLDNSVSP